MLRAKLRNRTCQRLDRQGQGQGPSLQGPGQGQALDLQGQGQGLDSKGSGQGQGLKFGSKGVTKDKDNDFTYSYLLQVAA